MVDNEDVEELADLTNELAKRMDKMADALADLSTHVRLLTEEKFEGLDEEPDTRQKGENDRTGQRD